MIAMGTTTQEIEDRIEPTNEKDKSDVICIDAGNLRQAVAFLKITKWSVSSEPTVSNPQLPSTYPIFTGANFIGRSENSSICFPYPVMSSRHACVDVKQSLHTIRDCNSTNETKRNGVVLEQEVRYELTDGVRLEFADIECSYYIGRLPSEKQQEQVSRFVKPTGAKTQPASSPTLSVLSNNTSTMGLTLLQNFLRDDSNDATRHSEEGETEANENPDQGNRRDDAHAKEAFLGSLTVLAEETQYHSEDNRFSVSLFGRNDDVTPVVGETERITMEDGTNDKGDGKSSEQQPTEPVDHAEPSELQSDIHDATPQANPDLTGSTIKDDVSPKRSSTENIAEIGDADGGSGDPGVSRTGSASSNGPRPISPTVTAQGDHSSGIQNITVDDSSSSTFSAELVSDIGVEAASSGGTPNRLNSLTVDSRLSALLVTPTSSLVTPITPPADAGKALEMGSSTWSVPFSNAASSRRGGKKSLLDVAAENWLFSSEPDLRRKTGRGKGQARKAVSDRQKHKLDNLVDKCHKWAIAASRASKNRKSLETREEEKMESDQWKDDGKATPAEAESRKTAPSGRDAYEFGLSQSVDSPGAQIVAFGSHRKPRKTRKSSVVGHKTLTFSMSPANVAQRISSRNEEEKQSTVEKAFDEAAERSKNQRPVTKRTATGLAKDDESTNEVAHIHSKGDNSDDCVQSVKKTKLTDDHSNLLPQKELEPEPENVEHETSGTGERQGGGEKAPAKVQVEEDTHEFGLIQSAECKEPSEDTILDEVTGVPGQTPAKRQKRMQKGKRDDHAHAGAEGTEVSQPPGKTVKPRVKRTTKQATPSVEPGKSQPKAANAKRAVKKEPDEVKVCFTQMGGLPKRRLEALQEAVKDLGGQLVDSGVDCTHLVIPKIARSAKFMCAVARGVPIVTPEWVEGSKRSGSFVDTKDFIVKDEAEESRLGFTLSECLRLTRNNIENGRGRLFDGYTFYSTVSVRPNRDEMKAIVTAAGGNFLCRLPKLPSEREHFFILSCEEDAGSSEVRRAKAANVPIVSMEFVMTGLLKREIHVEKYEIFTGTDAEIPNARTRTRACATPTTSTTSSQSSLGPPKKGRKGRGKVKK